MVVTSTAGITLGTRANLGMSFLSLNSVLMVSNKVVAFTVNHLTLLSSPRLRSQGGTSKFWQGCSSYYFNLGLKFGQIQFFCVGKFFSYFSGFCKISAIFLGLTNFQLFFGSSNFCITHLNEKHTVTVLKNKIIVAFHSYSNFDHHCILSHSIFLGLNFGAFYFFGFKFSHSIFLGC